MTADDAAVAPDDVDWRTLGAVAGKLGESLAGLTDAGLRAAPGTLHGIRRELSRLQQVAGRLAGRQS